MFRPTTLKIWRSELHFLPQFIYKRKKCVCNILLSQLIQFRTNNSVHSDAISVITATSNSPNHQRSNWPHCPVRSGVATVAIHCPVVCVLQVHPRSVLRISNLGALAELWKATISLVMSVCPSVRSSSWNNSVPLDGFSWNLIYLNVFRKSV